VPALSSLGWRKNPPKGDGSHGSPCLGQAISTSIKKGIAMKKIAVILALAFALTTGMTLTTAFGCGLFPLLSNDACFIAKDGTGQLPHLVALPPSHSLGRIAA
jgi:hypothetical protein